jgi:hypothetical protein
VKTYTFASATAPVQEHMAALVKGIEMLAREAERNGERANSVKSKRYWTGKVDAFRDIIEIINDSNSI